MICASEVDEQWLPVVGAESYYSVSSLGRVRSESLPYVTSGRQRGRILSPALDTKGYPIVKICVPGMLPRTTKVHRLVARVFLGPAKDRQVNHINGIKADNRAVNLEYVTCRENIHHCWQNGLHGTDHCRGAANVHAKLTTDDVQMIRHLYPGFSQGQLAALYGVSKANISMIVRRQTWRHV